MKKSTLVFLVIIALIILGTIITILLLKQPAVNSSPSILETCQTLSFSSNEATNLVFFSSKKEAEKYSESLFEFAPFNENKDAFNIYYIEAPVNCELYEDVALFCHSTDLIKKASSCPNDYLIVLEERPIEIRSSAYTNVLSINTKHPLSVMAHEFGHAFANLAEEYTPANIPSGSLNCALSCDSFNGLEDGCFQGCSSSDHVRSIEEGVMKTLRASTYGSYNEFLISSRLNPAPGPSITGNTISEEFSCSDQNYILIEANYSSQENTITLLSRSIEQGCPGSNGYGNFTYEILDSQGFPLVLESFNPELIFTDAPGEEEIEGETFENEGHFLLKLPLVSEADKLEITHGNNQTLIEIYDLGARACIK